MKINICIVSPELVRETSQQNIKKLRNFIKRKKIYIDAVCTKEPEIWDK